MTHFFGRYLRETGLWTTGRATHVFRHTVVAKLRATGVPEEVITDVVGHTGGTQTRRYGKNRRPVTELAAAIAKLEYGVDIAKLIAEQEAAAAAARDQALAD